MDINLTTVKALESELKSKDSDLKLAVTYEKELIEEIENLKLQINDLKQENYSVQRRYESETLLTENINAELELQKSLYDKLNLENVSLRKETVNTKKKLAEYETNNEDLQLTIEELLQKQEVSKARILALEKELENHNFQLQVSLNETNSEELQRLLTDLQQCQNHNNDLLAQVIHLQSELDERKSQEFKLTNLLNELQQAIENKDEKIQSNFYVIQKSKEEVVMLQSEIETLKFEQTDVNRRGNSIFSEVEDRRKLVEAEYTKLKSQYRNLHEHYELQFQEISKTKRQLTIALSMFSQRVESQYVEDLHTSLNGARKEVGYLMQRLNDLGKTSRNAYDSNFSASQLVSGDDQYNYLRTLFTKSQKKAENLESELQHQCMLKLAESDKLHETQKKLYITEQSLCSAKSEILRLKLKLEEMDKEPTEIKPNTEVIAAIKENTDSSKQNVTVLNISDMKENDGKQVKSHLHRSKENLLSQITKKSENEVLTKENTIHQECVAKTENITCVDDSKRFKTTAAQVIKTTPNEECIQQ